MSVAAFFIGVACRLAADRCLDCGVNISRSQTIASGGETIDVNTDGRLTDRTEYRQIGDARYGLHNCFDLVRGLCQRLKVAAEKLDRVLALDPGNRLLNIVLNVLREIEFDAGKLFDQRGRDFTRQCIFIDARSPIPLGLQRYEEFGIEKSCRIRPVVRTSMLRYDRLDFREILDHLADLVDVSVALFKRNGGWHRRSNPKIAFFEMGQEFEPQRATGKNRERKEQRRTTQCYNSVSQCEFENGRVEPPQPPHDECLSLPDVGRQQHGAQGRRNSEGSKQSACQSVSISLRHWTEDVPFDPTQGE